jgi:hypothetical protein
MRASCASRASSRQFFLLDPNNHPVTPCYRAFGILIHLSIHLGPLFCFMVALWLGVRFRGHHKSGLVDKVHNQGCP